MLKTPLGLQIFEFSFLLGLTLKLPKPDQNQKPEHPVLSALPNLIINTTIIQIPTKASREQCSYVAIPWRWFSCSDTAKLGISTLKQINQNCHAINVTNICTLHLSTDVNRCWLTMKHRYNPSPAFSSVPSLCHMFPNILSQMSHLQEFFKLTPQMMVGTPGLTPQMMVGTPGLLFLKMITVLVLMHYCRQEREGVD
jgi:hypothetical protein